MPELGGGTDLGSAYGSIVLDADGAVRGVRNARNAMQSMDESLQRIGASLGVAGAAMTALAMGATNAASDLSESWNKVTVVFGDTARAVQEWSEDSAQALGQSQQEALEAAGTFGNLFTSMELGEDVAADMSMGLVELASDLASFNNIDPSIALEKLRSGLVGEVEPLRTLGVQLSEAQVQLKAMEMGLADSTDELTVQDKVMARYQLILDQTTNAQGDFARTADGLANSTRIAKAEAEDAAAAFGESLQPAVQQLTEIGTGLLDWFNNLPSPIRDTVAQLTLFGGGLASVAGAAAVLGPSFGSIMRGLSGVTAALGVTRAAILGPVGLVAALGGVAAYFKNLEKAHRDEAGALADTAESYIDYAAKLRDAKLGNYELTEAIYDQIEAQTIQASMQEATQAMKDFESSIADIEVRLKAGSPLAILIEAGEDWWEYVDTWSTRPIEEIFDGLVRGADDLTLALIADEDQAARWAEQFTTNREDAARFIVLLQDAALRERERQAAVREGIVEEVRLRRAQEARSDAARQLTIADEDYADSVWRAAAANVELTGAVDEGTGSMGSAEDAVRRADEAYKVFLDTVDQVRSRYESMISSLASGLIELRGIYEGETQSAAAFEDELASLRIARAQETTAEKKRLIQEEIDALKTAREEELEAERQARQQSLLELSLQIAESTGLLEQWSQQRFGPNFAGIADEADEVLGLLESGMLEMDASLETLIGNMAAGVDAALTGTAETADENKAALDDILSTDWVAEKQAAVDEMRENLAGMLPEEDIEAAADSMWEDVLTIPDDPFAPLTRSFEGATDAITLGMDEARDALNEAIEDVRDDWKQAWDDVKEAVDAVRTSIDLIPRVITITVEYEEGGNGMQSGGPVLGGKQYLVGEAGPELFVPDQSGLILPAGVTQGLLGSGDNASYQTVNVDIGIEQTAADAWAVAELTAARLRNEIRFGERW